MDQSLQILTQVHPSADGWKNTPITVSQLQVVYDYTHNREALFVECTNTSPLSIRSLYFDMDCYDDAGDLLGKANGVCIRNLDAQPDATFGKDSPMVIPYSGTCKVDLTLQKVVFSDNSVWRCGDALPTVTSTPVAVSEPATLPIETPVEEAPAVPAEPAPIPAELQNPAATIEGYRNAIVALTALDHPNAPYLIQKFTALADKLEAEAAEIVRKEAEAKAKAEQAENYDRLIKTTPDTIEDWQKLADAWKAMGNYKDAPKRSAEILKKIKSMKASAKRIAEKEAEAARIAAEQKAARCKATIKASMIIGITLLSLTALVLLFNWVLLPAHKQSIYNDAEDYLAEGKYSQAIELWEKLDKYSDSKERIRQLKIELTGNPDAFFATSQSHPGYSIDSGVLTFDKDQYEFGSDVVQIPDYFNNQKVTQLSVNFLANMTKLTKVILPSSLAIISESAFDGCTALTTVEAPGLIAIGNYAFRNCTSLTTLSLPSTLSTLGTGSFQGCTALKKIDLPEGIRTLNDSLFLGCTALTDVKVSSQLKEIDDSAFANCTALTALNLPDTVTTIGNNAFLSCVKLNNLNLPASISTIGDKAFGNCISLTSLKLGNKITKISSRTFSGCTALVEITLPDTLTAIGFAAFENCSALKTVRFQGNADTWAAVEIQNGNNLLTSAKVECAN